MEYTYALLEKALAVSREAHTGQLYGKEDYFSVHIAKVVYQLAIHGADILTQIVGAFHDIYEDTGTSRELIVAQFGEEVDFLVWSLTRQKEETYFDYIRRVKNSHPVCKTVKLEDATCNYKASVMCGNERWQGKYSRAMLILLGYD